MPEKSNKKTARSGPRFQGTRNFLGAAAATAACGFGMYVLRVAYYRFRPEGNDRAIVLQLQDDMRLHPHWAAAMVYTVAHHALSDSPTPFGSPLVYPEQFGAEIKELLAELRELQLAHPGTSLPDLWAAAATYALASLGGPLVPVMWGRYEEVFPPEPIAARHAVVSSNTSDITVIKRLLMKHELAPDEMVSLIGHRTLGCHDAQGLHQYELMRVASREMITTKRFAAYDSAPSADHPGSCTETPGVFDNDYFATLASNGWTTAATTPPAAAATGGSSSWFGKKPAQAAAAVPVDAVVTSPAHPHVMMRPLDAALKNDSLLAAWIVKFAENELRFFSSFERSMERLMRCGWEGSKLRN